MERDQIKQILAALRAGKYEVDIKGPEGITRHFNYAGEVFLRICRTEIQQARATCTVRVMGHCFVCDLLTGQWKENDVPLTSTRLIQMLEKSEGVVSGEHHDVESLIRLYTQIHGLPFSVDYCWTNDYTLKAVGDLGQSEVGILVRYTVKDEGGWDELDASVDDGQLYQVYRLLKQGNRLPQGENEIEVLSEEIEKHVPELYADILEQIEDEFSVDEEYHFSLPLTHDIFETTLYDEVGR